MDNSNNNDIINMINDVESGDSSFEEEQRNDEIKKLLSRPLMPAPAEMLLAEGEELTFNDRQAPKRKDTAATSQFSSDTGSDYAGGSVLNDDDSDEVDAAMQKEAIKQRSRCCAPSRSCCKRCGLITIALILITGLSLLAAIFLGSRVEARAVVRASDTFDLYNQKSVCALEDVTQTMSTFPSAQDANEAGLPIAHCGTCGGCSFVQDITIYAETRNTLTVDATKCALRSLISLDLVSKCLDKKVGFTPACRDCWTENIGCTKKCCKWTCLKFKMLGGSNNDGDGLNECLQWYVIQNVRVVVYKTATNMMSIVYYLGVSIDMYVSTVLYC
jgi:hypothetical protein